MCDIQGTYAPAYYERRISFRVSENGINWSTYTFTSDIQVFGFQFREDFEKLLKESNQLGGEFIFVLRSCQ